MFWTKKCKHEWVYVGKVKEHGFDAWWWKYVLFCPKCDKKKSFHEDVAKVELEKVRVRNAYNKRLRG